MHPHYHRSKSVDLSRKRSLANHEAPPVATATIIMNPSANLKHSPQIQCPSDPSQNPKPTENHPPPDITLNPPPKEPDITRTKQRRASESDISVSICFCSCKL